jgi:gamma-glutamyltranspeptidase/glutathione hydrolase
MRPGAVDGAAPMSWEADNLHRTYPATFRGDTTHTCAIDARGNMMAATTSGGWIPSSPVVPGLGFPMGTRAQMFSLDPHHPNSLQPRKRPAPR